jgi:hypothetical protein|eukprot:g7390.t1 g7390   contig24:511705-514248(+)
MSRSNADDDPRFKKAVRKIVDNITISVPEAMKIANFTTDEINNLSLHQRIRRAAAKACGGQKPSSISVHPSTMSSVSTLTATPPLETKHKRKNVRHTSAATQQIRKNKLVDKEEKKRAVKYATSLYANRKDLSARVVSEIVEQKLGIRVPQRTIQSYVKEGRVGTSPKKKGPQGVFDDQTVLKIGNAMESYIQIKQLNGESSDVTFKKLQNLLKQCTIKKRDCNCEWLLKRLLAVSGVDLKAGRSNNAEQRRIMWTTYYNLKSWFDNWESDLLKLGFAKKEEGKTVIPKDQLARILNVDETCLVMDGSSSQRGGRPAVVFTSGSLPDLGKATIKSSAATTMITGSTAAGEAIPPHFQFATAAKSDEMERIRADVDRFAVNVKGKFGCAEEREWPCTIGMNEKGGMDEKEFMDYFLHSLVPLYPDAEDIPGKRVMVKVDSGPGRLNPELLSRARNMGFYIYPGVPNTTAVTQETDQSYGPFKTQFVTNLKELSDIRIQKGLPSLAPHVVPLFVFGGIDPDTRHEVKTSAFEVGFAPLQNIRVWSKCGAAPITRAPLHNHDQVRRELGDADDKFNLMMRHIQSTNDLSAHFLNENGFDGSVFKVQIKEKKEPSRITVPHGQERIDAIAKASTHGKLFHATGGTHLTCDDIFIATEKKVREGKISELTKKREKVMQMRSVETGAKELLQKGGTYKLHELKVILKYYQVQRYSSMKRSEALAKFEEIRGTPAPAYGNWTDADERELLDLTTKPISIGDTALGRHRTVKKMELHAAIHTMSKEEREELRNKLNVAEEMEVDEVAAPTVPILPNANPNDDQIPLPSADTQLFPDEMSDDEVDTIADNNNVQAM